MTVTNVLNDCPVAEAAEAYAAAGWGVFPVYEVTGGRCACGNADCGSPGKHPRVARGLLDATTDREQIRTWRARCPNANIGVRTGVESGLVVLDLDREPERLIAELEDRGITWGATPTARTGGGGLHVVFRHPGGHIPSRAAVLTLAASNGAKPPQVDIRGDGGYIVVSPSLHVSGQRYTWLPGCDPFSVELAEFPTALLQQPRVQSASGIPISEPDGAWFDEAWGGVPEGQRNDTAARLAGYWLHVTHGNEQATFRAMEEWARRCVPPMAAAELRDTIRSIARREGANRREATRTCEPLSILPAREFVSHTFTAQGNIIAGGNLPYSGKLCIVAPGGSGKTLIVLQVGVCLASGGSVLGEFPVVARQRVGLFLCEDPPAETQQRFKRQLQGVKLSEPPDGLFLFTRDEPLLFGGPHGKPREDMLVRLTETVRRYTLSVVIFDPLVALHEADENSNSEMTRWLFRLGETLQGEGCAIVLTHHVAWGQDGEQRSRGASAIQNWADTVWNLRPMEAGGRKVIKLTLDKINFGPRWEPLVLTLDPESLLFSAEGEQSALCPIPALLEYLRDEHGGAFRGRKGELYEMVQANFGAGRRTVREAFRAALSHQPPLLEDLGRGGGFKVIG